MFIFLVLPGGQALAQNPVVLKGRLINEQTSEGIANVTVRISGEAQDVTTSSGHFKITLPKRFKVGNKIQISLDEKEWLIKTPVNGEMFIPSNLNEPIQILVSPKQKTENQDQLNYLKKILARLETESNLKLDEEKRNRVFEILKSKKATFDELSVLLLDYVHKSRILGERYNDLVVSFTSGHKPKSIEQNVDFVLVAVKQHNLVYRKVNERQLKFKNDIELFWHNDNLESELKEILNLILDEINKSCILPFNKITELINNFYYGNLKKKKKQKIKPEVKRINFELQEKLGVQLTALENRNRLFLKKLNTSLYQPGMILKLIEN